MAGRAVPGGDRGRVVGVDGVDVVEGVGGGGRLGILELGVGELRANRNQPRRTFDEGSLDELAASIRQSGVMQPVLVRPVEGGGYELIAGERRWRAARKAGLATIPAIVRELGDREAAEWAIVENVQREDLNPLDKAEAIRNLLDRFGLTHAEVAERVGVDRASVSNQVRLLELEGPVQDLVRTGRLSLGHAKVLLGERDVVRQRELGWACAEGEWSVRELERAVRRVADGGGVERRVVEERGVRPVVAELEKRLSEHLGSRVRITTDRGGSRGRIVVEFFDLDQFDGVLERMGVRGEIG